MVGDEAVPLRVDGVAWSVHAESADGAVLLQLEPDLPLPGASLGKLLLLTEVAARFVSGDLDPQQPMRRTEDDVVLDSGLWQLLAVDSLPAADLAVLVAAVSDNLATNVLLRDVGLDAVADRGRRLGLRHTVLHDRVRDWRGPNDPPSLSTVTARELVLLMRTVAGVVTSDALRPEAAVLVREWLAAGCDLSMVAAAFGLDPLAHRDPDRGRRLVNKTGTDRGVRGEAGVLSVEVSDRSVAYAAVAAWDPSGPDRRDAVLAAMRRIGERVSGSAS